MGGGYWVALCLLMRSGGLKTVCLGKGSRVEAEPLTLPERRAGTFLTLFARRGSLGWPVCETR